MFDPMIEAPNLLETVAEQLRAPLVRIQALAGHPNSELAISVESTQLLRLLDNLHFAYGINPNQQPLELEPVSLSVLCDEVAHRVTPLAKLRGLDLVTKTSHQPVLANKQTLSRAYESMVFGLLELAARQQQRSLTLHSTGRHERTRLGVYSTGVDLKAEDFNRLKRLFAVSNRPLPKQVASPALHLYIADRLLVSSGARLKTSIHQRERGVATQLLPSHQLSLVSL